MAKYTFWYTEETTYEAGFEADSLEQAKELLEKLRACEIDVEDLTGFWNKDKDGGTCISIDTLEGDE